jgi:hypothetical protein
MTAAACLQSRPSAAARLRVGTVALPARQQVFVPGVAGDGVEAAIDHAHQELGAGRDVDRAVADGPDLLDAVEAGLIEAAPFGAGEPVNPAHLLPAPGRGGGGGSRGLRLLVAPCFLGQLLRQLLGVGVEVGHVGRVPRCVLLPRQLFVAGDERAAELFPARFGCGGGFEGGNLLHGTGLLGWSWKARVSCLQAGGAGLRCVSTLIMTQIHR